MLLAFIFNWFHQFIFVGYLKQRGAATGQGLVEYALILVLVAVVVVIVLVALGPTIGDAYSHTICMLTEFDAAACPS
jgi:pilus assembly protein Flp/PilA